MSKYTFEQLTDTAEHVKWTLAFTNEITKHASRKRRAAALTAARRSNVREGVRMLADGVTIGYATVTESHPPLVGAVIHDVYVMPEHRGRGCFSAALPALVDHVGATTILLADFNYDRHRDWYASLGFVHAIGNPDRPDLVYVATDAAVVNMRPVARINGRNAEGLARGVARSAPPISQQGEPA